MKITRWCEDEGSRLYRDPQGDWVDYDDHEEAVARLEAAASDLLAVAETFIQIVDSSSGTWEQINPQKICNSVNCVRARWGYYEKEIAAARAAIAKAKVEK